MLDSSARTLLEMLERCRISMESGFGNRLEVQRIPHFLQPIAALEAFLQIPQTQLNHVALWSYIVVPVEHVIWIVTTFDVSEFGPMRAEG